ncbi:hypothetical protein TRFO_36886 [Tritrichomonas foetus]|uniref:Uncharacterized protein n=1 Tax=Tritrichomonas foetus TaxID=1144522 RepID=A0A1J4JCT5_9EUKA|nr:hypothetical protein TRFO_36886 [Tritrichomonas foetus]|eukprot:OHS96990.1 hypothetical protein TRFO_36886 [Tritrichomonas foetus]
MEKLSGKLSLKLYELLPPPFSIKQEKFHEYWVDFYTSLKDAYEKDDFKKIYSIFEDTRYLTEFHIAVPPKDLERDIIYILYKIMTTMPIKNYLTQITACTIIHNFMMTNIRPQNLEIPWKPLYDFVYFIFLKDDLVLMNKGSAILVNVLNVISDLSPYFSEGSTPEIIQTLLPHISPRGSNSVIYMSFLSRFVPVFDSSYKEWFPNFIQEVKDAGNAERFCPLFRLIARIVHHNINDDFHYLVPLVMNSFSLVIINEFMPDFITVDRSYEFIDKTENHSILTSYVSEAVMVLCMSPSTKRAAVEEFTTIMNGARDLFHPSVSMNSPTMMFPFIYAFVSDLRYHFREVHREISFVPVESLPSQEEIHLILKPVVDLHLMMIHTLTQNDFLTLIGIIRIINELDPTTVYRYFEFAFQCIMLTDAECVAEQGWTVMTAVLIGLKNTPLFEQHIQELFELAVNNFFVVELQTVLMRFLYVVFSIFPFNKETAPPGLKNFPFELLSVNFMNAIIDACRSFPAIQGKYARVNSTLLRTISMVFHAYIMGASYEVLAAIQPILITILSDSTLMHSFPFFGVIYNYFFVIADDSLRKPILKQMKDLLSLNLDTLTTCNLIRRFIRSTSTGAKTKEEMQEALDFIMPYTKHPLSQVRKEAWYSIGNALFQEKKLCIVKPTKDILIPLSDFKFELFNFNFDQSEFVLPLADDIIGKIMNAKDPKSVTEILKETKQIIFAILNTTHEVIEGDSSNITPLFKKSPFYIEELIKPSVPVREKFFDLIIYLLDNYPDNVQILKATMRMLDGILSPILSNYTFDNSIELSFLKSLWSAYPLRNKYNIFELSHRIGFSYHRRAQYHHPICPGLIKVVNKIFILGFSKFTKIRTKACLLINGILAECSCLLEKELKRFLRDTKVSNVDELLDFLTYNGIFSILSHDENLLVPVLKYVCTQLNADDQETNGRLQSFIGALCSTIYPLGVPSQHSELWDTLLADLIDHVEKDAMKDRTLHI